MKLYMIFFSILNIYQITNVGDLNIFDLNDKKKTF
jgi:hypothetical protein